jgi:hypothetical protein
MTDDATRHQIAGIHCTIYTHHFRALSFDYMEDESCEESLRMMHCYRLRRSAGE